MKFILIIIYATISLVGYSQNNSSDTSASCVAYWKKGERRTLSIIHNKVSYKAGEIESNFRFAYEADVLILDSTTEGYKVQWTFHLPQIVKKAHPLLADSLPVYEGMKMVFTTSGTGAFVELLNWQEVKDAYVKMMEFSLPKNLDSAGKSAVAQSKAVFNSREMVEASLINEIRLFYFPFGYKFSITETKANTELPNPFGDEPLPAVQTFQITELKPEKDYFKLLVKQDIDKTGAEKILDGLLKKMNITQDSSIVEGKKMLSSLEITEHREYYISQSTGWLKNVRYRKTAKNIQINQIDSYLIDMKN